MRTALPAIALLAVLGAVLAVAHRNSSVEDRLRETRELGTAAAVNTRGYLEDRFAVLAAVAASPAVRQRSAALRRYLVDLTRSGTFDALGYVDARGRSVIATSVPPGQPPIDLSDREYVRSALAGQPAVSDALDSRLTGRPIVAFAYPVTRPDGEVAGLVSSTLQLDDVNTGLRRRLLLGDSGVTIIDGEGNTILGSDPVPGLMPAPEGYPLARMRAQGRGVLDDVSTEQGTRVLGFQALPASGWLVVTDRARADVLGSLDSALYAELAALALLAAAGVALTFGAARRLDRLDRRRDEALAQQREIALQLQDSMLPGLRVPEGLQAAAGYVPAQGAMAVGGDWYDVVVTGPDRVALSVGDVAGHGLDAAATMGQLRSATRSAALFASTPADALAHLDDFVGSLDDHPLATVVYAVLDVSTGVLRYASAGHPPPLLLRVDGTTEFLEGGRSALLGVGPGAPPRAHADVGLAPGDTLILYTDGLIERPDSTIDRGLAELAEHVRSLGPDPTTLTARLLASVEEPRRDDAAVLAVRLTAARQPSSVPS